MLDMRFRRMFPRIYKTKLRTDALSTNENQAHLRTISQIEKLTHGRYFT
jgi:hypothetical protein